MQEILNNSINKTNNQQTFVINEALIPAYNPLTKQMSPTGGELTEFCELFKLPKVDVIKTKHFNTISLKELKIYKPENTQVNVFNPIFPKEKHIAQKKLANKHQLYNVNLLNLTYTNLKYKNKITFITHTLEKNKINKNTTTKQTFASVKDIKHLNIAKPKNSEGVLGISISLIVFLLYIRLFFKKQLKLFLRSSVNRTISSKIASEKNVLISRASNYLNLFYLLTISFFVLLLANYTKVYPTQESVLKQYGIITLSIFAFYATKWVIAKIISHILKINDHTYQYFSQSFIFNKSFAIISLPALITIAYLPEHLSIIMFKITIYFALLTEIFRVFRLIIMSIQKNISILYLFLYLCALEIMPIIILVKLVFFYLGINY